MKLPQGKRIMAGESESFLKVCKQLEKNFGGIIKLRGRVDGKTYSVELLVDSSNVIAASLRRIEDDVEIKGDEVLSAMKKTLAGSEGELELYSLGVLEIHKTIDENRDALVKSEVPLSELKVKIKLGAASREEGEPDAGETKEEAKPKEGGFGVGILGAILGMFKPMKVKKTGGEKPKAGTQQSEAIKQKRIEELKRERLGKVDKIRVEGERERVKEGRVVETTIDKLYEIVRQNDRLRIDDRLSKQLGVTKTQIEAWAMVLEEHDLLELHYPAIGEPEIRRINKKP